MLRSRIKRLIKISPTSDDEVEEWLLSRPSLMEIDVFLFSAKGWDLVVSSSKDVTLTPLTLSKDQINRLKKDKHLSSLHEVGEEKWLEVIVPLHFGTRVIGGIRVVSSLDEAQSYLSKKRDRAYHPDFLQHPRHLDHPHAPLWETGRRSNPEIGRGHVPGRKRRLGG